MIHLFHQASENCSRIVTDKYSTSFSSAIRLLHKEMQQPIYNIYGFVRFADEIVDTFHDYDKPSLLKQFREETYAAIERDLSLNPILNSFQQTVNQYDIDIRLIDAFFNSMELDISKKSFTDQEYTQYIYGSAETVGLMCLYVFCEGNRELWERLQIAAKALGAAFQKVNFLRDIKADYQELSRVYFPACDFNNFTEQDKKEIERDIEQDFQNAYKGILQLPFKAKFGVYVAYRYYLSLFKKIRRMKPARVLEQRVRIPNLQKAMIILRAGVKSQFRLF